jgi:hypothetical protein
MPSRPPNAGGPGGTGVEVDGRSPNQDDRLVPGVREPDPRGFHSTV